MNVAEKTIASMRERLDRTRKVTDCRTRISVAPVSALRKGTMLGSHREVQ